MSTTRGGKIKIEIFKLLFILPEQLRNLDLLHFGKAFLKCSILKSVLYLLSALHCVYPCIVCLPIYLIFWSGFPGENKKRWRWTSDFHMYKVCHQIRNGLNLFYLIFVIYCNVGIDAKSVKILKWYLIFFSFFGGHVLFLLRGAQMYFNLRFSNEKVSI